MPLEYSILNLDGYEIEDISGINPVIIKAKFIAKVFCPDCHGFNLRKKDTFKRTIRHESIGDRKTYINIKTHKYSCKTCGKYFNQQLPGVLKWHRSTEGFRREVFEKHNHGICQKTLAEKLNLGTATIERWYHDHLKYKIAKSKNDPCPIVIGIDEHFFSRKHGYATTICNLVKHKVYDIVLGRSELALDSYFRRLKGKERVQVVVMDMSETYRSIIRKHFPNAKIVSDRFHIIRLINHHFLKLWQQIDPIGRKNRGLLSLMRRHEINLKPEQKINLKNYFQKYPELEAIYDFKQELCRLMLIKRQTKRECRKLIPIYLDYLEQLKNSMFDPMVTLGKTLDSWSEEVVRMWRFTKTNGITEGFHTKMEMITRRAYGFRNFENYRLRVKALCC
jgi:transposase